MKKIAQIRFQISCMSKKLSSPPPPHPHPPTFFSSSFTNNGNSSLPTVKGRTSANYHYNFVLIKPRFFFCRYSCTKFCQQRITGQSGQSYTFWSLVWCFRPFGVLKKQQLKNLVWQTINTVSIKIDRTFLLCKQSTQCPWKQTGQPKRLLANSRIVWRTVAGFPPVISQPGPKHERKEAHGQWPYK